MANSKFFFLFFLMAVWLIPVAAWSESASPRLSLPLRVDLMRKNDSGETRFAVRCTKGIAADNTPQCELRKYYQQNLIASANIDYSEAAHFVDSFFTGSAGNTTIAGNHRPSSLLESPLSWSISDGKRTSEGGVITHGTLADEKNQKPVTSAILALEVNLESQLIR